MFGTNRIFTGKKNNFEHNGRVSSTRASRRKPQRRRIGSLENLERREMMAADFGLGSMPQALVGSEQVQVAAPMNTSVVTNIASINDNSTSTAQNLGAVRGTRTINGYVGASDPTDFYRIVLDERDELTLRLDQLSADIDLYLYNANGQEIARSWLGGNAAENIVRTLDAGVYFVRAARYGSAQSNYRLTVDVDAGGESFGTANNLGTLSGQRTITDFAGPSDGNDYFRFNVNQQTQVTLRLDQLAADLDLYLYNSSGEEIARSWLGGASNEQIQLALGAGTYYARVTPWASAQSNYRLSFTSNIVNPPPTPTGGFQISLNMSGLSSSQQAIFNQAVQRWQQVITGDLPDVLFNGQVIDDLRINASATVIDGNGGILGQAGPERFRSAGSGGLPYLGSMEFDTADIARMEQTGQLFSVVMHEIGHILGIGTVWDNFGLLVGAGTSNPIFTGAQATAAYNQVFGTNAAGVPVENTGGGGTRDSHFRESILGSELMTGYADAINLPLSRITVGSLADIGYTVNFAAADAYSRPGLLVSPAPSMITAASMYGLTASPNVGGSLASGLSPDMMDAAFSVSNVTRRMATPAANSGIAMTAASTPQMNAVRSAVMGSSNWDSELNDSSNGGSDSQLQATFESAWNDLASQLFGTV